MSDNDFPDAVQVVDQDAAEQRITEPASHDDELYAMQLSQEDNEPS